MTTTTYIEDDEHPLEEERIMDRVDRMMAYEEGKLDPRGTLELFAELIGDGTAWQLEGSIYGRPADKLIENGLITRGGEITPAGHDLVSGADRPEQRHLFEVADDPIPGPFASYPLDDDDYEVEK